MNKPLMFVVFLALVAAAAGGYQYRKYVSEQPTVELPVIRPDASAMQPAEPATRIMHPIPDDPNAPLEDSTAVAVEPGIDPDAPESPSPVDPLPALDVSDPVIGARMEPHVAREQLERFFNLDGMVRRLVVTVDNLPRGKLPARQVIARPVEGGFLTLGKDDNLLLDPANFSRYKPLVRFVEQLDSAVMVSLYVHFYPLFQQAYEDLGYPSAYFNDRLIEVIDHLLATPEVQGPIRLSQPRVFFTFANPELEALSAGHKVLIRIGPDNANRLKAKLREIRRALASENSG